MPNRILKDSICSSEDINALTWEQEVFWYRLIVQCDDYGRMDARPAILRARCYPLAMDRVSETDVVNWLRVFQQAGMVQLYSVAGKPYLKIASWDKHQQQRAKRSKYPDMLADDSNGNHLLAYAPEDENPNPNPNPKQNPKSNPDEDEDSIPRADGKGTRPSRQSSSDLGLVCTAYEQVLGQTLTAAVGDMLWDCLTVDNYPAAWIVEAMQVAVSNNVRKLKYVRGILENWRTEGKTSERTNGSGKVRDKPPPQARQVIFADGVIAEVQV